MNDDIGDLTGDDWFNRLADSHLRRVRDRLRGAPSDPVLTVTLGRGAADSFDTAVVTQALQKATGKLAFGIRNPSRDRTATYRQDREMASLVTLGQSGGTIYFGFPPRSAGDGSFDEPDRIYETLAEQAINELVALMPASENDDAALDAILVQRQTARSAAHDLVKAVGDTADDLRFRLDVPGREPSTSVLSVDQAKVLRENLRETETEVHTEVHSGVMDGVRSKRRVFYLLADDLPEVHGAMDHEQLEEIKDLIDVRVQARLEVTTIRAKSGRSSRPRYRLLDVVPLVELPGFTDTETDHDASQ